MNSKHNLPDISVSEISNYIKRSIEENFSYVRIRGEVSGLKMAPSGHVYFNLKDDRSLIAAICWKGSFLGLKFKPEEGAEVICTGRITTYAGQSKYQLIIENIEPAGVGALMALLEKRKKQLAAEGLFEKERKKPLPFLPNKIGIITSPTGAVIKDMLHRLEDRFPVHVQLWPVLVQGDLAADQIEKAILGFNNKLDKVDLIILARGGGSIEDLWPFNEENVVRAIANSSIPIISAIGHETDTTLSDFAADKRAPTPSAAAEMAVPVKSELQQRIDISEQRLTYNMKQLLNNNIQKLNNLVKVLPTPERILEVKVLNFKNNIQNLDRYIKDLINKFSNNLEKLSSRIKKPQELIKINQIKLDNNLSLILKAVNNLNKDKQNKLDNIAYKLKKDNIQKDLLSKKKELDGFDIKITKAINNNIEKNKYRLNLIGNLLESYNYKKTLQRGFVVVKDENKKVITSSKLIKDETYILEFFDGEKEFRSIDSGN